MNAPPPEDPLAAGEAGRTRLVDLERLVAVQGSKLDRAYVRVKVVEMMGEGDERVARWDALG